MLGLKLNKPLQDDFIPVTKEVVVENNGQKEHRFVVEREPNKASNTRSAYASALYWCNQNNAELIDKGNYFEVVAKPRLSDAELIARNNRIALYTAKRERTAEVERLTVEVDGMVFDADEVSQQRVARSIVALEEGETMPWVLYDNTIVQVNKQQLLQVLRLAGQKQCELWVKPYTG